MEKEPQRKSWEDLQFNHSMVSFLLDETSMDHVPVITADNLQRFAAEQGFDAGFATRLMHGLSRFARSQEASGVEEMLYNDRLNGRLYPYGIRVERAESLLRLLKNNVIDPYNIGDITVDHLKAFNERLFSSTSESVSP